MEHAMEREVALVTPSHRKDAERFALLADSIDRHLVGYTRHYVIVNDDDLGLFAPFAGPRRTVMPGSHFLPRWLKLAPSWLVPNGRRLWWSLRSRPVHGWHVQQILKIAAGLRLPEQRFCFIDSDNVFVRDFDVGAYAGGERTPLYVDRGAVAANAPLHAKWIRSCDRLLGLEETGFPADDYIGNVIVWDRQALYDMTLAVERTTGRSWPDALLKARAFSEYLLYGHFVSNSPRHLPRHKIVTAALANAHWDDTPLDVAAIRAMLRNTSESEVALSIASFSHTPVAIIRDAVGLSRLSDEAPSRGERVKASL
jgi:hypothetical protein